MPEMRQDPVTGEWTIIATERAKRPHMPSTDGDSLIAGEAHDPNCFFCYGNEDTTPPEVLVYRDEEGASDSPGWSLRVVTNKYSALNLNEEMCLETDNPLKVCCYARGTAEVVIESPHHTMNTALFSQKQIELLLKAYRDRYIELAKEPSTQYVAMFKNNGSPAGASLSHPHSQIIATPVIPPVIQNEITGAETYYKKNMPKQKGGSDLGEPQMIEKNITSENRTTNSLPTYQNRCVYCDMIESELKDGSRIVYENDEFVCFIPYACRSPFETWILPKFHSGDYYKLTDKQLKSLSEIWKALLYKVYTGLDNPPYNYFIHTSPTQKDCGEFYHWHMELVPKMTIAAGFELGTGMFINIAIPEQSAEYLRGVKL